MDELHVHIRTSCMRSAPMAMGPCMKYGGRLVNPPPMGHAFIDSVTELAVRRIADRGALCALSMCALPHLSLLIPERCFMGQSKICYRHSFSHSSSAKPSGEPLLWIQIWSHAHPMTHTLTLAERCGDVHS